MTKKKMYRYLGRNGTVTTFIYLDGIDHIEVYRLEADKKKVLTNGEKKVRIIDVFPEEIDDWTEIDDPHAGNLNK